MAFNDDEKPASTPNPNGVSKQGLVTMRIPKYSKKDVALTVDSVTAMVELEATSSTVIREGLDLVAVVDVSGSMDGHKIESVKKALQFVIMKLTPVDRLSIVTFRCRAQSLTPLRSMTEDAKDDLKTVVSRLVAKGGTDIKAGLDMGLAILAGRVFTESRTANIFLMSDGMLEAKSSGDPRHVDPGEVSVYTFGFGQSADHKLLADIAKKSPGGTYSSVPDGTNLSVPFAQLLGGLLAVVAQDVQLTLTPKMADGDLDTMRVARGTDYTLTTDATSGVITIKFGTLFSGEKRKVAVNFTLMERLDEIEEHNVTLAVARHSYAAQETLQSPQQNIQRVRKPEPSTPDSNGIEQRLVQAEEVRRKHADLISQASELAAGKDLEKARRKIKDACKALQGIVPDDGDRMVEALRAELLRLLEYMNRQELYDKMGHPYALATIISHGRQRAAGRGDMEIISLYVTPRMIAYFKQAKEFEANPEAPVPTADEDVKEEMAVNPEAPVPTADEDVKEEMAANLEAPVRTADEDVQEDMAANPEAPVHTANEDVKEEMAVNPEAPVDVKEEMAANPEAPVHTSDEDVTADEGVKEEMAANPEAPVHTADEDVKEEMAANLLAAVSAGPLGLNAIQALQAIQKIIANTTI